ncbi:HlyD family efflux transporter periplasmic adaptor subunit [Streptomyces mayteni]
MQFRREALAKLRSPEELDLPVRLARPPGRLVLAVTFLVMTAAAYWAFTGSVSATQSAPGILTPPDGSYVLESPVAGQVTRVLAAEGDTLEPGDPLLQVATEEGDREVPAVAGGRVTALLAREGAVVTAGAEVATLEHRTDQDEPLVAVLYLPGGSAAAIPAGARVDLDVQSVPRDRFGVLRGRVLAVGGAPQTSAQLAGFLGDEQLAAQFAARGNPVAVLVELETSPTTESGYRWSSDDGPPFAVDSRTPVTGTIRLSEQRPVDWLLP